MKKLKTPAALLVFLVISVTCFSQADSTIFKVKIDQYQRVQRAGSIVLISGAAVEAAGVGLVIAGFNLPEGVSDDPYVMAGYALIGVGIATMATGLIFRGIGKRKTAEYRIKLHDVRTGFYFTPRHSGIVLTYRF
jgi:hypothetical protein